MQAHLSLARDPSLEADCDEITRGVVRAHGDDDPLVATRETGASLKDDGLKCPVEGVTEGVAEF